ncbi:head-tail connector protein [Acidaminococcus fermentans]|uniref:head-tail connector protein n=1 Tax=Acidaminococcus fermentans TaxID=905 RepID=UPI003A8C9CA7
MAVTLSQAKNWLKIDSDITEDDELITELISAANEYIEGRTGKRNNGSALYDQCIRLLVCHWYENRAIYSSKPGAINPIPHSADALIIHIAQCGVFPMIGDDAP